MIKTAGFTLGGQCLQCLCGNCWLVNSVVWANRLTLHRVAHLLFLQRCTVVREQGSKCPVDGSVHSQIERSILNNELIYLFISIYLYTMAWSVMCKSAELMCFWSPAHFYQWMTQRQCKYNDETHCEKTQQYKPVEYAHTRTHTYKHAHTYIHTYMHTHAHMDMELGVS